MRGNGRVEAYAPNCEKEARTCTLSLPTRRAGGAQRAVLPAGATLAARLHARSLVELRIGIEQAHECRDAFRGNKQIRFRRHHAKTLVGCEHAHDFRLKRKRQIAIARAIAPVRAHASLRGIGNHELPAAP